MLAKKQSQQPTTLKQVDELVEITVKSHRFFNKHLAYKEMTITTRESVTVDETSRTVSGYAAVFGNKDSADDILIKGCFAKSIEERGVDAQTHRKIAYLWQHDTKNPIGKLTVLKEDDYGLYFEAVIDDVPDGNRALTQMKSGTINQFSIGYNYVWDKVEYDAAKEAFIVKEVILFEISPVTIGCNELTYFAGMKAEDVKAEQNKINRDIEDFIEDLPYKKQVLARQLFSKAVALAEQEPPEKIKQALKEETISEPLETKTGSGRFCRIGKQLI
jgi:HK97 family phage prohead protease